MPLQNLVLSPHGVLHRGLLSCLNDAELEERLPSFDFYIKHYIVINMKSFLIEIDDETAAKLERVAPARSRRRSEFVRSAIRKAIWVLEEQATRRAYEQDPDSEDDIYYDPAVWESS